ncbi:MAG: aminotransferase class V-fold PLP-dependent enzyme [Oscillospiraceae bacterium]|nr:aminotransferase class V-fold PLP-dependent enzyme [Oscillospiraceae bacterium]
METPIVDFVEKYAASGTMRLHMPGHKGVTYLGPEKWDLTEVTGADSLYEADGVIAKSEENASKLFGCHTFYSTEGSSHCIRAMLTLAAQYAVRQGKNPVIAAARNAHKTFLCAAAMLDLQVRWLYPQDGESYLSCRLTEEQVDAFLAETGATALYLTSPDYLGNMADVAVLSEVCHKRGCLLLVDNAHGAHLRFLKPSLHPMDLGADLCCDSAHKTLPVLTGGAYLHISSHGPVFFAQQAKNALALHGSTSPSYLILQSLDLANRLLETWNVAEFAEKVSAMRRRLEEKGLIFYGNEPMKLTLDGAAMGCGTDVLCWQLEEKGIEWEFADPDYLVLMLSPAMTDGELARLESVLEQLQTGNEEPARLPAFAPCRQVMSLRQAMLAPAETLPVEQCVGRVLAQPSVGCPPAVPIVICGEMIDAHAVKLLRYYGVETCTVVL